MSLPRELHDGRSSRGHRRITVIISSVACEGMRLSRPQPIEGLDVGMRINIRTHVDAEEVALPGVVAWLVTSNTGETHVGVSLWLEAAAARDRHMWARWIVARTEELRDTQRANESTPNVTSIPRKRATTDKAS